MVAYFFPPLGGAGVQRSLKFARYLPESGWEPRVLTADPRGYWIRDPTLLEELPEAVRVQRVASPLPVAGGRKGRRGSVHWIRALRWLSGWFLLPDAYLPWSLRALAAASRWLRRDLPDVLWTTSSPDSAHLVGWHLSRRWRIPWVADFRDPWVERLSFHPPTRWHRAIQYRLEEGVVRRAVAVVLTSQAARDRFAERYPWAGEKLHVITNGYDEEDFAGFQWDLPRDRFRILHLGQLNPERSLEPLLGPLRALLEAEPEARGRVELLCVGPHYASHEREVRRHGLQDVVRFEDPRPHREAVRLLGTAHLLLLLECEGLRGRQVLPGKTFEYLRSGRPVLALVDPLGDAARLVPELRAGWVHAPSDAAGVLACLRERWARFRSGEVETGASAEALRPFERRELTLRLAHLFDRVARKR
jgi:glycosyltransferase involved in cell wall biosynthesis